MLMMKASRVALVGLLVGCGFSPAQAAVKTEKLPEGKLQVHYYDQDKQGSNAFCETVVMICVGTAMSVEDYQDMGTSIVQEASHKAVAIIIDNNPWSITNPGGLQKQDGQKYTNLVNAIYNNITSIVPVCSQRPHRYLIGGHSGGGQGAVEALRIDQLDFTPSGFVGLAPFRISPKLSISIPSLNIGFSKESCGVNPKKAALAAYSQTTDKDHRVFYELHTTNKNTLLGGPHCSFAGAGCLGLCKGKGDTSTWMHGFVGKTVNLFIEAIISSRPFEKKHFSQVDTGKYKVSLFVNSDVAPSTPIWPNQWSAKFSTEFWGNLFWQRSKNTGTYAYDWTNGQSLEQHGEGQKDNWCGCASKQSDNCRILSYSSENPNSYHGNATTYAHVGDVCCMLFNGWGPLEPTWLESPAIQYNGPKQAGDPKRTCYGWENTKPGNRLLMSGDLWLIDDSNIPCGYKDVFKWWAKLLGLGHYFTFDASTYKLSADAELFDLPLGCQKVCPNRGDKSKPWCAEGTWDGN